MITKTTTIKYLVVHKRYKNNKHCTYKCWHFTLEDALATLQLFRKEYPNSRLEIWLERETIQINRKITQTKIM